MLPEGSEMLTEDISICGRVLPKRSVTFKSGLNSHVDMYLSAPLGLPSSRKDAISADELKMSCWYLGGQVPEDTLLRSPGEGLCEADGPPVTFRASPMTCKEDDFRSLRSDARIAAEKAPFECYERRDYGSCSFLGQEIPLRSWDRLWGPAPIKRNADLENISVIASFVLIFPWTSCSRTQNLSPRNSPSWKPRIAQFSRRSN